MKRHFLAGCAAIFVAFGSHGQDPVSEQSVDYTLVESFIQQGCDYDKVLAAGFKFNPLFFEYDKYVTKQALVACQAIFDDREKTPDVKEYWSSSVLKNLLDKNLQSVFDGFKLGEDTKFSILNANYLAWQSETELPIIDGVPKPPTLEGLRDVRVIADYFFLTMPNGQPPDIEQRFVLTDAQNKHCEDHFKVRNGCVEVFDAFASINRKLSAFQRLKIAQRHDAFVAVQQHKWDKFSDNSRFQTYFDVAFTSWVYRKHFSKSDDIISPPPLQLFALRPSIVYEHLSSASKGSRDEPSLALEWVGFNAWDWVIPFGVSLTSVYSDRESSKSVGHGLTFHLNNSFSFGVTSRGHGDNGVFLNIEFMDWFTEKKNAYNDYRKFDF